MRGKLMKQADKVAVLAVAVRVRPLMYSEAVPDSALTSPGVEPITIRWLGRFEAVRSVTRTLPCPKIWAKKNCEALAVIEHTATPSWYMLAPAGVPGPDGMMVAL